MRILVLSDNHFKSIDIDFDKYDYVLHCGDYGKEVVKLIEKSVMYVRGNCDLEGEKSKIIGLNGKKIFLTHGDLYGVKYSFDRIVYKALEEKVNLVIFGHTHRQLFFEENGIYFINPGAYQDGLYAELTDNEINFFQNKELIKSFSI